MSTKLRRWLSARRSAGTAWERKLWRCGQEEALERSHATLQSLAVEARAQQLQGTEATGMVAEWRLGIEVALLRARADNCLRAAGREWCRHGAAAGGCAHGVDSGREATVSDG